MPPEGRDAAYLWDLIDAARQIVDFVHGERFFDYENNRMLQAAVERELEIIGEAANRLSDVFKASHPEIPWRGIQGVTTAPALGLDLPTPPMYFTFNGALNQPTRQEHDT
jgi:uncharacterized protein with HEPN domain